MLAHVLEDLVCCRVSRGDVRLRGYRQRVDEGLGVGLADVNQEIVDETGDQLTRRVDPRNQLRDHLKQPKRYITSNPCALLVADLVNTKILKND